jgi:regulator of sigma E protease
MNILIFILVLGLLIFIHELGHFLAAKLTGMKVEEFSVGFKPAIFQKKIGETNYVLGLIPIGGYVKILGENPNEQGEEELSEEDKKRTFSSRPKWAQITVLSMGVIFNILLA